MKPEARIIRETAVPYSMRGITLAARVSVEKPTWIHRWLAPFRSLISEMFSTSLRLRLGVLFMLPLLLSLALVTMAQENVRLACVPRTFQVVPGEPMRLELTVQADSAAPIRLHVPDDPLLVVRAIETLPVQRTNQGVIVHRRVVIWQALEPGTVKMNAITVERRGRKRRFPEISITVSDPGT